MLADLVDGVLHLALDLEVSKAAMGGQPSSGRCSSHPSSNDNLTHRSRSHHPGQGKPEGVVVVEVLGVVDEQLHVGSEGAPRLLADVLSSLIRVGLGLGLG